MGVMTKNHRPTIRTEKDSDCYLARLLNPSLKRERLRDSLKRAAGRRAANPRLVKNYLVITFVMTFTILAAMVAAALTILQESGGWVLVVSYILWSGFLSWIFWIHLGLVRSPDGTMRERFGIPNTLTFFRLLMVPAIAHYLSHPFAWGPLQVWGLFIVLAVGITDVLDGTLARLLDWRTDYGRFSDPMADVMTTTTASIAMAVSGVIPFWLSALIVFRYAGAFFGFVLTFMRGGRFNFQPTIAGKVCTPAVQGGFFFLFLAHVKPAWSFPSPFSLVLILTATGVVIINTTYLFYRWYTLSKRS